MCYEKTDKEIDSKCAKKRQTKRQIVAVLLKTEKRTDISCATKRQTKR